MRSWRYLSLGVFCVFVATAQAPNASLTSRVEGQVRTLDGTPVPKAVVQLVDRGTANAAVMLITPDGTQSYAGYTITADDQGKFVLENVAPGSNYRLLAIRSGYLNGVYGTHSAGNPPVLLTLRGGDVMRDLLIEMTPQGVIHGHVVDADGDPVAGAMVALLRYDYVRGVRQLTSGPNGRITDDRGAYRFANLAPGRYCVTVTSMQNRMGDLEASFVSGSVKLIRTFYPSASEVRDARPIDIPGSETQSIDIVMRQAHTYALRGTVVDAATGKPLIGERITVFPRDNVSLAFDRHQRTTLAPDGAFEFSGLPAGRYSVETIAQQGGTNLALPGRPSAGLEASIGASDVTGLVYRRGNGASIQGRVRMEEGDGEGNLVPSIFAAPRQVTLSTGLPRPRFAGRLGRDGSFVIEGVPAGRYLLGFSALPDDVYVKSVKHGDAEIVRSTLDVAQGRAESVSLVLSNKPAIVTGTVQNQQGEPLKSVQVTLWSEQIDGRSETGGVRLTQTDQNGAFRFVALPPDRYYVAAWQAGEAGLLGAHEFVSRFNGDASAVTVMSGGSVNVEAKIVPAEKIVAEIAKLP